MQIEVGTSSPNMTSTIHKCTHHCSSTKKAFHVRRAHEKAKCPRSGATPSEEGPLVEARITVWAVMPAQAILWNNGVMRCKDPVIGTEQIRHFDCAGELGWTWHRNSQRSVSQAQLLCSQVRACQHVGHLGRQGGRQLAAVTPG